MKVCVVYGCRSSNRMSRTCVEEDGDVGLSACGKDAKSEMRGDAGAPEGDKRYFDSRVVTSGYLRAVPRFTTWDDWGGGNGIVLRPGAKGDVMTVPKGVKEAALRSSGLICK